MSVKTMMTVAGAALLALAGSALGGAQEGATARQAPLWPQSHASGPQGPGLDRMAGNAPLAGLVDVWEQRARLTADDGAIPDGFGASVALSGDTAVVGSPFADVAGNTNQGAIYVFERDGDPWTQQAKLTADDGADGDFFGASVALFGDVAVVGAALASVDGAVELGAAYVFTRSGDSWTQQAKLTASDGAGGDLFGYSVALSGDTAVVGARRADAGGDVDAGAAYVFTRSAGAWSQQAKLTAKDGAADDQLGFSVAFSGDTALVGAQRGDVEENTDAGAVYVFLRNSGSWSQQAKLTANDGVAGDLFGQAVAVAGNTALVGAPGVEAAGGGEINEGAAYVFARDGGAWTQRTKLVADDAEPVDLLGVGVALAGGTALVGAPSVGTAGDDDRGAAYVFTLGGGTWTQQAKLGANDGAAGDRFGFSVALDGDRLLVGASRNLSVNQTIGAAYVFGRSPVTPVALDVDSRPLASDGNRFFEPGEQAEVAPAWRSDHTEPLGLAGAASDFSGPVGAAYDLVADAADYGVVAPGSEASCMDTEACYTMEVDDPAVRPAIHWDAAFVETLTGGVDDEWVYDWTLHLGDSFTDVSRSSLFYGFIETLLHHGVTGGCTVTEYCPAGGNTRAQMAVFLLKAAAGAGYVPPACINGEERFADVPFDSGFCPWIEELAERGVTSGCGGGDYCPGDSVTRAQMAVFLLKALEGQDYTPPACTEAFADVPCASPFATWIEELAARGVTGGCAESPPAYCPGAPVTRAQMATFVVKAFELTL